MTRRGTAGDTAAFPNSHYPRMTATDKVRWGQ